MTTDQVRVAVLADTHLRAGTEGLPPTVLVAGPDSSPPGDLRPSSNAHVAEVSASPERATRRAIARMSGPAVGRSPRRVAIAASPTAYVPGAAAPTAA